MHVFVSSSWESLISTCHVCIAQGVQLIGRIASEKESNVLLRMFKRESDEKLSESDLYGVAWWENKIHVLSPNQVHVYHDRNPFNEMINERIELKELDKPRDMTASKVSRSLFISDYNN